LAGAIDFYEQEKNDSFHRFSGKPLTFEAPLPQPTPRRCEQGRPSLKV